MRTDVAVLKAGTRHSGDFVYQAPISYRHHNPFAVLERFERAGKEFGAANWAEAGRLRQKAFEHKDLLPTPSEYRAASVVNATAMALILLEL
jgi:hypothetical protein